MPINIEYQFDASSIATDTDLDYTIQWGFANIAATVSKNVKISVTVDITSCQDYLQVPSTLAPSSSSFEIGANAQEIEIFPALLASSLYSATSFDADCGDLQVSLQNIDQAIASVSFIEEE